jgi:D-xylose transport system permease protein
MARVESDPAATERSEAGGVAAPAELADDPTAATQAAIVEVPPALVAQSLGEYLRAWLARIRSGDSGVLPVLLGLVIIAVVFQAISPNHVFLTAGNLVNLFQQSAVFMVLAMAEIFVLLLGEIDLSLGYVAAVGGVIGVQFVQPATRGWPWWAAILIALASTGIIGAAQGTLISRLRLPSFVVTLAGYLIFNGMLLILLLLGPFSGIPSLIGDQTNVKMLYDLMWGNIDPNVSWIGMAVIVGGLGLLFWFRDASRRRSGLVAPPASLTLIKIGLIAVIGVAIVAICNTNRGVGFVEIKGVPWVIPIVLGVLAVWTVLLERTRFGRYIYAIGGNAEAARRAGINLPAIRTWAFALCSLTGGIAGLLYASYLGGMSNNVNGGQLVLYAVAAAVIGGTSLFGGRGRVLHGMLGGLVIGGIYNGMFLLSLEVQWQFIVTGFVLLVAVAIDALSRRGATAGSATRA